ncbi:MAG: glycosyltransferase [Defluviitaleaceae bacterium]|nr:glycosyltransferase [Defluviitaleaceae bacterium]
MKIVHIQPYYNDGFGYHENLLPLYQAMQGHEVILLTSTLKSGFNKERVAPAGEFIDNGFSVKRLPIAGEFKDRFVIFKDLYSELKQQKPDYIFHHHAMSLSVKVVCKYKKDHPKTFVALDNHADLNITGRYKIWKCLYYNLFWKRFFKKFDSFVDLYFGVTPLRCLFLEEEMGIKSDKIRLLPLGTDTAKLESFSISKKSLFSELGIDPSKKIIVHGGKITPEKKCDRLIQAFSKIDNPDWQLVLFGRIEHDVIRDLIMKDSRIVYIDWLNREKTISVLKYSDIGIWNTQHTALLEDAVAVGLPLILRFYGSTCHLIRKSGFFLYDESTREIQDKLTFLLEHPTIVEEFKNNAKELSHTLSYNNVAKESIEYYYDTSPKALHVEFMNDKYFDRSYPYIRKI